MKRFLLAWVVACCIATAQAKVKLPNILASNAVLQQNSSVMLWGEGEPNSKITIRPSWTKQRYTTQSASDGRWSVAVETISAGGAYTISFDDGSKEITTIENIMLGEVWLCCGQSNMRMPMSGNKSGGQPVEGVMDVIMQADSATPIRCFRADYQYSYKPEVEIPGEWRVHSSQNISSFSATAYFFAQYIHRALNVPVGIVECAWDGAKIEAWMSADMLRKYDPAYEIPVDNGEKPKQAYIIPTILFNGLLAPLKNLAFQGAIWYQGESNLHNISEYPALFKIFVESLRADHFDNGNFPFYYAQIAPYGSDQRNAFMRETMAKMIDDVDNTGMAVLSDLGEEGRIHPRKKQEVGERLAYWALAETYGRRYEGAGYRAPEFNSMRIIESANKSAVQRAALNFNYAPMGLCLRNSAVATTNFEVAGEDRVFHPATARIGSGKDHIIVWCDKVKEIAAVRYGFRSYFDGDVYNTYGVPISSFRTDDWQD